MKVTDIDIRDLKWDDQTACFRGAVSMLMVPADGLRSKQVNFICQSHRPQDCPSSLITYDLVTHALTQARQMPGFRRGEEEIQVDILPSVQPLQFRTRRVAG